MNQHTRRAVKASMAAAGAATLGVSFVGTAAAMDFPTGGDSDSDSYGSSDTPESMLDQGNPVVDNDLLSFEMPRMETSSYDSNYGDDDNVCHGFSGSQNFGNGIVFQHPCESHDNSFGEGNVQFFGHTYKDDNGDGDDDSWNDDGYSGPFHMAAFSSPISGYQTADGDDEDSDSDSDFGDDSGPMSMLSMGHDQNAGDTDQDSPSTVPMDGFGQMDGYSFGQG